MADRDHPVDDLLIERRGAVGWIILNRPEVRNAITLGQRLDMAATLAAWSADASVRAVVVTGSGGSFCAGADLRSPTVGSPRPVDAPERIGGDLVRRQKQGAHSLIAAILDCEKPVIAAVNGVAAGMGVQVALACDLVVAASGARLIEIFVPRGLVPDAGGVYLLSRVVGRQKVKEILFFGDAMSADEARVLGLVNVVVDDGDVASTASAWAERLAAGPTRTIALTKWLANRAADADRTTCFDDEAMAVEMNMHSRDAQEGLAAFIERRDPHYLGW